MDVPGDYHFTTFDSLAINWINDGHNPRLPYPRGSAIDLSHGQQRRCIYTWKVGTVAIHAGLNFVKCKRCGVNAQVIIGNAGSLAMPCNMEVFQNVTPSMPLPTARR